MNIVYIEHYAGTPALGMEFRPYYLAREWVRAGHRVQILAASYSHVRARQPAVGAAPLDEAVDGIAYRWYPTPAYQGNGLGRVRNIFSFLRQVWADTRRLVRESRPDVVIASSTYPMDIWVARRLARRAGARLVFEVHDLWPLSPIELSGMSPGHPFARLCAWAEGDAYRDADVVVSMLPCVHEYMASRGLDLRRLAIVPNGISPDDWAAAPAPLREDVAAALARARAAGETVVGYAGSMGEPNALDTLLDAAALLRDDPAGRRMRIVMVGDGHLRAHLAARVQAEGLANVTMLPPIPKPQVPALLAQVDVAYIGWQRVPIYRFGIAPNKLMDYMMAGRAVLHSVEAGNDPVAEAGCGITVAPGDPRAVADGLLRLAAVPAGERAAMGARGRAFVEARHTYPVLAARFLEAVSAVFPPSTTNSDDQAT
jgi:glycosyltransferase involved in cell wall biosynthesis